MWAFAGPACMGNQPTAVWLASLLADNGPDEIVNAIGRSADSILRRYPERARRLAVVAAGWHGSPDALSPRYRQIANFDASRASSGHGCARTEERLDPRRDKAKVFAAGVELPRSLHAEVEGLRAPSRRPPERERGGCRRHPGRDVLQAGRATAAGREACADRIDPARLAPHAGETARSMAAGSAWVVTTPFRGCGSAGKPSPTGQARCSCPPGCRMLRRPGTCLATPGSRRVDRDRFHCPRRGAVARCVRPMHGSAAASSVADRRIAITAGRNLSRPTLQRAGSSSCNRGVARRRGSAVRLSGLRLLAGAEDPGHPAAVARRLGAPAAGRARAVVDVAVGDHDVERVDRGLLVRVAAGDP